MNTIQNWLFKRGQCVKVKQQQQNLVKLFLWNLKVCKLKCLKHMLKETTTSSVAYTQHEVNNALLLAYSISASK